MSEDTASGPARPRVVNAMSVDVEEHFHVSVFDGIVPRSQWARMESRVVANTHRLLDLFDEFGVRSTFFVLGWVAEQHRTLVGDIADRGHEIASHGYAHRLIYDQTPAAFREDVRRAKRLLEDASGCTVAGYRAPSYSITPRSLWALDILIDEGYGYDASIFPIRHDRYGIPVSPREPFPIEREGGVLMEVPGSTLRVGPLNLPIAGGGYFRILPYAWTRWGIARLNRTEQQAAVFYIHPWEIDPDQPRLAAGSLGRFRHYRNLDQTESRLRTLLTDFRFGTVGALLRRHVPETAPGRMVASTLPYFW
ncbi:MAG TPA: XrtA system polysaccharide deacetylase [Vicinamibacterales bacterium]|nr:XrtA system polysaccharide deacetylase [Vicinamibacterales bacterium]